MTRKDLREDLQSKGFTYRQADKLITAIIDSWIEALKNGGKLELPFGDIIMLRIKPYRDFKLGRIVQYRRPRFTFKEKTDG